MARLSEHGIRLSSMSPSFLNSNSTSHTWPFSAVAELIDNASDPGVSAKQIWIDVAEEGGHLCLTFTDNGDGMTPNKLHKMLSFGFTEKGSGRNSQQAIGVYGNGFKSGSMRLGRDALIFTKNGGCQTVGMLSQTYLENIKAQAVIVPIVPFNQQTRSLVTTEDSEASLAAILQNSLITSVEQIHAHFDSIPSKKGTKILIWNIRRAKDGKPELDFDTDPSDFRLPSIQIEELKKGLRSSGSLRAEENIPDMHYSLRAYLSVLYLKPRTQIILRGKKNLARLVSKGLTHIEHDVYKPHFSKEKVKVTFGLSLKNKEHYGIMMYHKNRLIKAYEKVGCQQKTSGQRAGVGVIGIIECNFLKPAHNKQDFEYTKEYRLTLGALGLKLNDYWREVTEKKAREREFQALDRDGNEDECDKEEGPQWLQCEECLKWRSVPASHYKVVPDSWNCSQNPNPRYRSCSSPEEAEDSEELLTPSYQKNHKKKEHPKSRKREKSLEVCEFQVKETKHQILSRSSSEPNQHTFQFTRTPHHIRKAHKRHSEQNAPEQDYHTDTHTDDDDDDDDDDAQTHSTAEGKHTQQKLLRRDAVSKDKAGEFVDNETNDHRLEEEEREEEEESEEKKDTNMEQMDGEEESTDVISHKRKSDPLFYHAKKKLCLSEEQQSNSENTSEEMNTEKQTETLSAEKSSQDGSGRVEKQGDTGQRILSSPTWSHSLPSTQTVMVSPLSRTEGPRSRPLSLEGTDREANVLKLAGLEKEAQRLRRVLGLEITKTTQGTMTTADSHTEKPEEGLLTPPASRDCREVGCQTDMVESSSSSGSPAQVLGLQGGLIQGQRAVSGLKEQPEQNRPRREKIDTPSRRRSSDSETSTRPHVQPPASPLLVLSPPSLPLNISALRRTSSVFSRDTADLTSDHTAMSATLLLQLLPLLLLRTSGGEAQRPAATVRPYYVAAVEIGWDYIYMDDVDPASDQRRRSKDIPQKYIKAVYREYTDSTYTVPKPRPAWTGIQGPVIVAKAGDKVVVHFKNLASQPYSISPVGITYWKQSEGAGYDDSTAGQEKEDDAVYPGGYYEYVWDISPKDGPTTSDPECLTYSYSSQVDTVRDLNSGLIGALLICKSSAFTDDGQRKNPAFVLLFAVFDETKSWYGEIGERKSREKFKRSSGRKEYHTINGYVNSTLPGLKMCQSNSHVFWHLIGVGSAPEIHSIQFQDHSLQVLSHRKVTVEVTPMTFIAAEMRPAALGSFLISCQIYAHRHDGMNALFTVEKCADPVTLPGPDLRNVKHKDYSDYSDEDVEDMFNTISFNPRPQLQARSSRGQQFRTWKHFIAIEEVTWDYAPHLQPTDSELQSGYLPAAPHHLGYSYKKAVYVEYTDGSFTQRKNPAKTLLGPLLKGKINDEIHITLKNLASRPFNIYPNGLTRIYPLKRSRNAAEKDLRSMGVPPNSTFDYVWRLTNDDGPLNGDPQCLTQLYQSTVSPERDLASGLVGTLLICKNDAIDVRGHLLGPDKEWSIIFAVFDENISWYMKENMQKSSQNSANTTDPEFYNSNVIYSVNGIMFSARQFVICQTDVAFWHVANVGTQSDFLSVYFTGNLFQYQGLYQSVLTLFPMTGVTVPMEPELMGEWEISAFDGSLKSRGMSIQYTVRQCDNGDLPLVDRDTDEDDISDYLDNIDLLPRGRRPKNRKGLVYVCKKPLANDTQSVNSSRQNVTDGVTGAEPQSGCLLKEKKEDEGIPLDILEEMEIDGELTVSQNDTEPEEERGVRQRRHAESNETDVDISSGASEDIWTGTEIEEQDVENRNDTSAEVQAEEMSEVSSVSNGTKGGLEESNEILQQSSNPLLNETDSAAEPNRSEETNHNYIQSERERLTVDLRDADDSNNTRGIGLSLEYDDYNQEVNDTSDNYGTDYIDARSGEVRYRHYYIAAEEISWDYGIRKPHQLIKPREMRRGMRKFLPEYKKVVFRAYKDKDFQDPVARGELQEHLGIMGPFIRTEINNILTVIFKNKASRPYSFHLQGVYDRSQGAGFVQTHSSSAPPGVPGEPVAPGEARTYNWRITKKQGPTDSEFDCKAGAYYSTVDKERDLHSGLIGPLVICKPNTLRTRQYTQPDIQEFSLLFHTFDETKSWYLEENLQQHCAPPCQANTADPWYHISNKFAAINGYVAETLPGLLVARHQRVRWHLLNVGSDGEYHAVHFHGLPFTVHTEQEHRMGVYNLFPGVFGTVEMRPPTVGTWLVECTIGDYQLAGMRAKLLVYNPSCVSPLGMKSGRIEDSQITASDYVDNWQPQLARLDQSGYINAWMGKGLTSWLQVDLQRPTLLHGVQTQGVRARLRDNYITFFTVSYSLDRETWTSYKGNSTNQIKVFYGNLDSSKVKHNHFFPPFVARYIRIQPMNFRQRPALRMELLGCDLNSCSLPLGLQRGLIPDGNFSASSSYSSLLRSWTPNLARLHQEGRANAWRPKNNNPHEWLQVDLGKVHRITGVVTQGARSLLTQMMVTEFSVTFSFDGQSWHSVLEENSQREKIFTGNSDSDEEALSIFDPPLFGQFLRIHPRGWINDIALRLEVLGCDTQQGP